MLKATKRIITALAIGSTLLLLSSCSASPESTIWGPDKSPKPSASSSPKPSKTPKPDTTKEPVPIKEEVATSLILTLKSDSVYFDAEPSISLDEDFSYWESPSEIIASINEVTKLVPDVKYTGDEWCYANVTIYKWGDFLYLTFLGQDPKTATEFVVGNTQDAVNATGFDIKLTTEEQTVLGGSMAVVEKNNPNGYRSAAQFEGSLYKWILEVESENAPDVEGYPRTNTGVMVSSIDDKIVGLKAPGSPDEGGC